MMRIRPEVRMRMFMAKVSVSESGCWAWLGKSIPTAGGLRRGRVHYGGKEQYASRVSYMLHVGPITDGLCVLHKCDNPMCVRPDHLFLGTRRDNAHDMLAKRRQNYNSRDVCGKCGSLLTAAPRRDHFQRICRECNRIYQRAWARKKYKQEREV